jgi:hypothetical protein
MEDKVTKIKKTAKWCKSHPKIYKRFKYVSSNFITNIVKGQRGRKRPSNRRKNTLTKKNRNSYSPTSRFSPSRRFHSNDRDISNLFRDRSSEQRYTSDRVPDTNRFTDVRLNGNRRQENRISSKQVTGCIFKVISLCVCITLKFFFITLNDQSYNRNILYILYFIEFDV